MNIENVKKFLNRSKMQFVTIYSDGSGSITDHCEEEYATFDNTEEMYSTMLDILSGKLSAEERLNNVLGGKCDE